MAICVFTPQVSDTPKTCALLFGPPGNTDTEAVGERAQWPWTPSPAYARLADFVPVPSGGRLRPTETADTGGRAVREGFPDIMAAWQYVQESGLEEEIDFIRIVCRQTLGGTKFSLELTLSHPEDAPPIVKVTVHSGLPVDEALNAEQTIVRECLRKWGPDESSRLMVLVR